MTTPSWFRVCVRLLGVLFLGLSLPTLLLVLRPIIESYQYASSPGQPALWWRLIGEFVGASGTLAQVWFGWYLLFRGEQLIRYVVRDARQRCPECQYSTKGLTDATCPECGGPIAPAHASRRGSSA